MSTWAMLLCCALPSAGEAPADGAVVKGVLKASAGGKNLLAADRWRPWREGFRREGDAFVCDNGSDGAVQRGASQTVVLNQARPEPIVAVAWSRAESVGGSANSDYSLYLDLVYADGTPLWGQTAAFATGTHDWQRREVVVFPEKPVRAVTVHLLLRRHRGRAWFRGAQLSVLRPPGGACLFDTLPVSLRLRPAGGFQVRDVAAGSDLLALRGAAQGLRLTCRASRRPGAALYDVTLTDTSGTDRAVTLYHTERIDPTGLRWLADPRRSEPVAPGREYIEAGRCGVGANGRLSRWPIAAVGGPAGGRAVGIDPARPAVYRLGYNAAAGELFIAFDVALVPERPTARLRFVRYGFDAGGGFRAALAAYYGLFPGAFAARVRQHGLWMPFARISRVAGWEDFGFAFKEGTNETAWDDAHGILTFRYTEPMTWWMPLPKGTPRTLEAALAEARRLAAAGNARAAALATSGFHDAAGRFVGQFRDTPWCDGIVWSMNSAPGIRGRQTDFRTKWNAEIRGRYYGPGRNGDLDGEYVDSSECYVTAEMDFRRDHIAAAATPPTFDLHTRRPGVFKLLAVFEYVRALAADTHAAGRLMMANGTPSRVFWLAPLLDVLGTETNWNPSDRWRPMSHAELLYRRAVCGPKPYCFLMNTQFERFGPDLVEKYMKRCLAYGMFPGFFSHNASQGHYFTRPALYGRDRALFRKYVPLCRRLSEAGWRPIPGARADAPGVYVERFGERLLTVCNDTGRACRVTVTFDGPAPRGARELLTGRPIAVRSRGLSLDLPTGDVAVIEGN